ncbi:protein sidekick-2-like [Lytechinus pictus]|uniref:protein sidekick-2-like n=1 Tax=Lytechinus pictus TaxID=7653 RepID=UPI0030B9C1FF
MRAKIDIHEAKYGPWSENVTQQTLEEAPRGLVDGIISKSERVDSDPYKRNVRLSWKGLGVDSSSVSSPSLRYGVVIRSLQRNWTTNGTSITIPDLNMFSKCCGSIHAFNSGGNGERATFCIPDNSSVPRIPSVNFTSHPTSILVSIYTPKLPNGVIRKYEIRWKEDCSTCLDSWSNMTFNVTSKDWLAPNSLIEQDISLLQPSAWYIIEIEVFNKEGSSKRSRRLKTGLNAPSAPPRNVTITTVKDEPEVVDITWTSDESDVMVSGYQILYCALDDGHHGHNTHCNDSEKMIRFNRSDVGEHNLIRISSLIPFTRYSFRLQPFNDAGPGPISAPVVIRTLQGVPSPLEDVNMSLTSSSGFVDFTWSEPLRPNGVTYYEISYNGNSVRRNTTFVQLKVYGDTVYDVGVRACSTGGLCSAAIKKTFTTPIGAPSSPHLGKIMPSGPTTIKVYWDPPEHPNGPIKEYVIKTRPSLIANPQFENFKVVDVDRREDDVPVECGEEVGEDKEFRVEIFARTLNVHGLELDGESDTGTIDMCGAKNHVPDMVYILLIIPALIFVVLLFTIIYRQWFKESRKLNIYLSAIANVRKRSKRLQQLRIPKPMEPERETFDIINQCPSNIYIEDKLHKDKELIYHLLVTDGTTKNVPSSRGYTCMTKYKSCSVLSTRPESVRQDVCDAINGKGRSSGSNGYLPVGLGGRISKLTVPCVESLSKKLLSVPANSYLTQSLPRIDVLTTPSPYRDKKDVGWEHRGMRTIDKPKEVAKNPPKPIYRTEDVSVSDYCTLTEL